jgi:hypothetical protein
MLRITMLLLLSLLALESNANKAPIERVAKLKYQKTIVHSTIESEIVLAIVNEGSIAHKNSVLFKLDASSLETEHDTTSTFLLKSELDLKRAIRLYEKKQYSDTLLEKDLVNRNELKNKKNLINERIRKTTLIAKTDMRILNVFATKGELALPNKPLLEFVPITQELSAFVKLLPSEFSRLKKNKCLISIDDLHTKCKLESHSINNGIYEVYLSFNNTGALERHQNVMITIDE